MGSGMHDDMCCAIICGVLRGTTSVAGVTRCVLRVLQASFNEHQHSSPGWRMGDVTLMGACQTI